MRAPAGCGRELENFMASSSKVDSECSAASILLVDDDSNARFTAAMLLRKKGCKVDEAENGIKAIELLEKNSYTWIISDVRMPEMDGFELVRQIRSRWPNSKIVLISAFCHADEIESTDIQGFFEKPLDTKALCTLINDHSPE